MKFCYLDESGTGYERYAVLVGIVVDGTRMHVTKSHWNELLDLLSTIVQRPVREFHTKKFYGGRGIWSEIDGDERTEIITTILSWFAERHHHVVYSAVDNESFESNFNIHHFSTDIGTLWRMMAFHVTLALQKNFQSEARNKGNTVLVFDNKETDQEQFTNLVLNPPGWSDSYYGLGKNESPLDQIIDVPHFVDSEHVGLIQVADLIAFILRRYLEVVDGGMPERYAGETTRLNGWSEQIFEQSIPKSSIYPSRNICNAAQYFRDFAPESIL